VSTRPNLRDFEWLSAPVVGPVRIALYRSNRFPLGIDLFGLFRDKGLIKEIVLCKDEKSVASASKEYSKFPRAQWLGPPPGTRTRGVRPIVGTGYRLMSLSTRNQDCVMYLNWSGIDTSEMNFITNYASVVIEELHAAREMSTEHMDQSFAKIEWILQTGLGCQFAVVDDYLLHRVQFLRESLFRAWAEHSALKRVARKSDPSELSKFVNRRIDLIESGLKESFRDLGLHGSYYQIFHFYTLAQGLCAALSNECTLRPVVMLRIEELTQSVIDEAERRSLPSLADSTKVLHFEFSTRDVFQCVKNYETELPAVLEKSGTCLKSEFVEFSSSLFLMNVARQISLDFSLRPDQIQEEKIQWFLGICDGVASNTQGYQLTALIACRMKLFVLQSLGYYIEDPSICSMVERQAVANLRRFEGSASGLKRPFRELGVDDSDLVLDVMGSMNLCIYLGDNERAWRLRTLIEERRSSPVGRTAWTLLQWNTFIAFEDYDSLSRFHSLLSEIRYPRDPRNVLMEPSFAMLEQFANALMIEQGRYVSFARARNLALDLSIDPERLIKSLHEYEQTLALLEGLEFIYRAADSESMALLSSNLRHAVETLSVISSAERPASPNRLILMKADLLEGMMCDDGERVSSIATSIPSHPFVSETTLELSQLSSAWVNAKAGTVDPVITALNQDKHPQSPWIRIARRICHEDAKEVYQKVVRDRARLIRKPVAIGGENYRRGRHMESLLQLRFTEQSYIVQPRLILEGIEVVDIFCYRKGETLTDVVLVDVKYTKKKYGPKEARDFAGRVREVQESLEFILPSSNPGSFRIKAVVASASGISKNGKKVLEKHLEDVDLQVLPTSLMQRLISASKDSVVAQVDQQEEIDPD